jgi:hypothetical protein
MKRMSFKKLCLLTALCAMSLSVPSYAIFGLGIHYGMDFSLSMSDKLNEQLAFDNLTLNTNTGFGTPPAGFPALFQPAAIPIFIDRADFTRSPFNLGAKVYVDIIPFIDAVELSGNFGVWEYNGSIRYPTGVTINSTPPSTVTSLVDMENSGIVTVAYDTMDLTLKGNGMKIPGLSLTPYMKLQMELNVRKYLKLPVVGKIIKPYAGGGFGVHFATPAISAGLVNDAIGDAFTSGSAIDLTGGLVPILSNADNQKKIVETLISKLMTPHYGIDILAGIMIKPPIIPIGIYADGKYIIPFGPYDKDAKINGMGFLVNVGLALAI